MKRTLVSLLSLLGLAMAVTSCQKDENTTKFSAVMEMSSQDGKTILNETNLEWVSTDQVKIYDAANNYGIFAVAPQADPTTAELSLVSGHVGDAPYMAYYPVEVALSANSINLPATQVSEDGSLAAFPMVAMSNNGNLFFKNICGALKIHLQAEGVSVSSIALTGDRNINGDYSLVMNGTPTISLVGNGSATTTLNVTTPQDITNGHDFYIYLPHDTYGSFQLVITAEDGSVCTKTTKAGVSTNIYRSKVTDFNPTNLTFVPGTDVPTGAINGLFSVSATKQVYFSMGNLQYVNATGVFQFAENQYDFIADNSYPASLDVIDLFGWATSGYNNMAPTMTSLTASDYGTSRNLTNSNYDWGVYNAIVNGGNEAGMWRTPLMDEWNYLINKRPNANQKWATGNINGIGGLFILPDEFTLPAGLTFTPGKASSKVWTRNSYTVEEWAQMEAAGAVFLPSNSYCRVGEVMYQNDQNKCFYWSAKSLGSDRAHNMCFWPNGINAVGAWTNKYHGHFVRLIQDAE